MAESPTRPASPATLPASGEGSVALFFDPPPPAGEVAAPDSVRGRRRGKRA
jgi:hypothetical protein